MKRYELSKTLSFLFYQNYGKVDGWVDYKNEFINLSQSLIIDFQDFKQRANKQMLLFYQKTNLSDELEQIKALKLEWLDFVKRFSKLESVFEDKYKEVVNKSEEFCDDKEKLKEFLAEYHSYETMESFYESLINLEGQIDSYRQICKFYQCQFQPI